MSKTFVCARVWLLFTLICGLMVAPACAWSADSGAQEQAQRQNTQPGNNAPVWRDVRKGENPYQTTQVRGVETNILMQSAGETWRRLRNGPLTLYGGLLLITIPLLIYGFFRWKGPLRLREKPTGRLIERFSDWERLVHWSTAISFLILAISGVIMLFGKYVLLPLLGHSVFSWLAYFGKNLHNFVGPFFVFCTIVMFVTFVRDNLWRMADFQWLAKAGGLLSGEHVPSARFNAGEKAWFWFGVMLLGLISGGSGLVMDFANFEQTRFVMQAAHVVHVISGMLFIAMSLAHIYIGTVGAEGAYEAMRLGVVEEMWAKEHHELWYEEVKAGTAKQHFTDAVPAEVKAQVAGAFKA